METIEKYVVDRIRHLEAQVGRLETEKEELKAQLSDASIEADRLEHLIDIVRDHVKYEAVSDTGKSHWLNFSNIWDSDAKKDFNDLRDYLVPDWEEKEAENK